MSPPELAASLTTDQYANYLEQWRTHWETERKADLDRFDKLFSIRERNAEDRDRQQAEARREREACLERDRLIRHAVQFAQSIPQCDGTHPDAMRDWLREIDISKTHTVMTLTVAHISSRNNLRRQLDTYVARQPNKDNVTWEQVKVHLEKMFLSPKELDKLRSELSIIKQGAYEKTPQFCMRFTDLAEQAYPIALDDNARPIQRSIDAERTILDAFLGGLADRTTAHMCLQLGNPKTFSAAIDFVTEFDANNTKLDITRQRQHMDRLEEPMEVNAMSQRGPHTSSNRQDDLAEVKRQVNGLTSQFTKLMATLKQHNGQNHSNPHRNTRPPQYAPPNANHRYSEDGRPICGFCNKPGHIQRVCRSRLAAMRQNSSHSNSRSNQGGR